MDKNNSNKETYYKLTTDTIWGSSQKEKTIAEQLGIKGKSSSNIEAEQEKMKYPSGRRLRTFQGDVAALMKQQQVSEASVVLAEQKKQLATGSRERALATKARNELIKNIITICIALLLLTGGGGALYFFLKNREFPVPTIGGGKGTIFTDKKIVVSIPGSITRRDLISSITKATNDASKDAGIVTEIKLLESGALDKSALSTSRFFQILDTHIPSSLLRSLDPSFLIGANQDAPFILFTTTFFESAFANMLDWETQMEPDIGPVFSQNASQIAENKFEDSVMRNKDTRVLRNPSGDILFLYTFPDREHLILTTNENTLSEILARLAH